MPSQSAQGAGLLVELQQKLRSPNWWVRREAADGLSRLGMAAEPLLQRALRDTDGQVRKAAVEAMSRIEDPGSTELLLEAVDSELGDVRMNAARILGERGEERALLPLMGAYTRCFMSRSALKQRLFGPYRLLMCALILAITGWQWAAGRGSYGDLWLLIVLIFSTLSNIRSSGAEWRTILHAILQIAERNPCPELHRLLPELRSLSTDRIQTYPEDREAARLAAARIEALTDASSTLPRPATAPAADPGPLPIPAALTSDGDSPAVIHPSRLR